MRRRTRSATLRFILLLFCCSIVCVQSFAEERIHRYHSDIVVRADGSAEVVETIKVRAEGKAIKRGIYRDVLTKRGQRVTFEGATRDGDTDGTRTERIADGTRLYVGRGDHILSPGDYTYRITYTATNVVRNENDRDELYWNVTGNGWAFTIDEASATVMFDADVPTNEMTTSGFTGAFGAKGTAYTITEEGAGSISIATTQPLPPEHGLTFIAGIPKGYFEFQPAQPTREAPPVPLTLPRRSRAPIPEPVGFRPDFNANSLTNLALAALVPLAYFVIVWTFIGRDPLRGRIQTLYSPPEDISPAAARFLTNGGYDSKAFAAAVLQMALKGRITIAREAKDYTIYGVEGNDDALSGDERELLRVLDIDEEGKVTTTSEHALRLILAAKKHAAYLEDTFVGSHFTLNRLWWFFGCLIALACAGVPLATDTFRNAPVAGMCSAFLVLTSGVAVHGLMSTVHAVRGRKLYGTSHKSLSKQLAAGVVLLIFGGAFSAILSLPLSAIAHPACVVIAVATGVMCWLFFMLMPAPTREGRKALDRIEAFRSSITGDGVSLRSRPAAAATVPHFENCFPYALALDAGSEWAAQFKETLDRDGNGYAPAWFEDGELNAADDVAKHLSREAGTDFAVAIGSAKPPLPENDHDDWDGTGSGGLGGFGRRGHGHFGIGGFGGGGFGAGGFGGGSFGGGGFGGGGFGGGGGGFSGGGSGGGGGGGW